MIFWWIRLQYLQLTERFASAPFGHFTFGQSAMKTMIDQIFSGDLAFGRSELKCFQWRLTESPSANPKFGLFGSYVKLGFVTEFELLNESFKNYPNCSLKHYESRKLLIFVQKWNILSVANFLNDIKISFNNFRPSISDGRSKEVCSV